MADTTRGPESMKGVKVLLFDVFGTVVNLKQSVRTGLKPRIQDALLKRGDKLPADVKEKAQSMSNTDWANLGMEWYETYISYKDEFTQDQGGNVPYKTVAEHNFGSLKKVLTANGLQGVLDDEEIEEACSIWWKLDPWKDSVRGLHMLKSKYPICTLSDGNVWLLQKMAEYGDLPWSHFFGGDLFHSYKPDPKVYYGGADKLGVRPEECALVAAHLDDLIAAKNCGYKTVYVERPGEERWTSEEAEAAKVDWLDICVEDGNEGLITAAKRLGCAGS